MIPLPRNPVHAPGLPVSRWGAGEYCCRMRRPLALLVAAIAWAIAPSAHAAPLDYGGHLIVASATGAFADVAGIGVGLQGFGVYYLDRGRTVGLRAEAGFLNYGYHEFPRPEGVPPPGMSTTAIVSSRENVSLFGIGPQFKLAKGHVRPFGYGTVGFGVFTSRTVASVEYNGVVYGGVIERSSIAFAWSAGGGIAIPVGSHLSIDAATEYRAHRNAEYVPPDGVTADPTTGEISLGARRGDANVLVFKLGASWATSL